MHRKCRTFTWEFQGSTVYSTKTFCCTEVCAKLLPKPKIYIVYKQNPSFRRIEESFMVIFLMVFRLKMNISQQKNLILVLQLTQLVSCWNTLKILPSFTFLVITHILGDFFYTSAQYIANQHKLYLSDMISSFYLYVCAIVHYRSYTVMICIRCSRY